MIESVVTKRLGALPVAAEFLRRLDVAGIVDALCPPVPRAELTHGQVIEVLVANRELARQAAAARGESKGRKPPASAGRSPGEGYAAAPGDDHGESSPCARLRELDENCTMRR
ncbi:hypothetical protein [Streptomyces nigrescens]